MKVRGATLDLCRRGRGRGGGRGGGGVGGCRLWCGSRRAGGSGKEIFERAGVDRQTVRVGSASRQVTAVDTTEAELGDGSDPRGLCLADIHLRNRDYNPEMGLFTSKDPLDGIVGTATETNPYHYANNNPLNLTDPLGLSPSDCSVLGKVGGFISSGECNPLPFGLVELAPFYDCHQAITNPESRKDIFTIAGCATDALPVASIGVDAGLKFARHADEARAIGRQIDVLPTPRRGIDDLPTPRGGLNLPFRDAGLRSQVDDVVRHFDEFGTPPPGVRQGIRSGGERGVFQNANGTLPRQTDPRYYTEMDVWAGTGPRGTERLVIGRGGEVYYTPDHCQSFVRIR